MKSETSQIMPPGLYLVATPIGNLRDITLRALDVLKAADVIACEDTRTSGKLLSAYGIHTPTLSYHEHNDAGRRPELLARLAQGQRVALVSDAGTPLVSDPGFTLVRDAVAANVPVFPLPGASSVLAALCKSGLPSDRFCFAGFLPTKQEAARKTIAELALIPATLVLFESPRRLAESLPLLAGGLGNRQAAVCRELTKLFEEARHGSLSELAAHYAPLDAPKGEVVLVIAPPEAKALAYDAAEHGAQLLSLLKTHSLKEAVALLVETTGLPRKVVYTQALALRP